MKIRRCRMKLRPSFKTPMSEARKNYCSLKRSARARLYSERPTPRDSEREFSRRSHPVGVDSFGSHEVGISQSSVLQLPASLNVSRSPHAFLSACSKTMICRSSPKSLAA